jgi:excisionase family DNA binding protein
MLEQKSNVKEWLPLSKAAETLNVHPTTLRRWADNGDIPCMLTPGGHRRFAASDLAAFAEERRQGGSAGDIEQIWVNEALTQTRQEIVVHRDEQWLANFDDEARHRHRLLGQQLMGLTMRYLSADNGEDLLQEARQIGKEYADIAQEMNLPLTAALKASIFFRDTLVDTALHLPENARVRPETSRHLLNRINTLLNAVHLAIAEVYDAPNRDSLSRS